MASCETARWQMVVWQIARCEMRGVRLPGVRCQIDTCPPHTARRGVRTMCAATYCKALVHE